MICPECHFALTIIGLFVLLGKLKDYKQTRSIQRVRGTSNESKQIKYKCELASFCGRPLCWSLFFFNMCFSLLMTSRSINWWRRGTCFVIDWPTIIKSERPRMLQQKTFARQLMRCCQLGYWLESQYRLSQHRLTLGIAVEISENCIFINTSGFLFMNRVYSVFIAYWGYSRDIDPRPSHVWHQLLSKLQKEQVREPTARSKRGIDSIRLMDSYELV